MGSDQRSSHGGDRGGGKRVQEGGQRDGRPGEGRGEGGY